MANLAVWKFYTPDGAEQTLEKLQRLAKQKLIRIEDAETVRWPQGKKKPKPPETGMPGVGALSGVFWSMLFDLTFSEPLNGLAVGADAPARPITEVGLPDEFISDVRGKVTEGTSALLLLTDQATIDIVAAAFAGTKMDLIQSNLSSDQEKKLKEVYGAD